MATDHHQYRPADRPAAISYCQRRDPWRRRGTGRVRVLWHAVGGRDEPPTGQQGAGQPGDPGVGWLRGRRDEGPEVLDDPRQGLHPEVRRQLDHVHLHRERQPGAAEGTPGAVRHHAPVQREHARTTCPAGSSSRGTPACCRASASSTRTWSTRAQINGKQYMIPWDWGYASLTLQPDHVDPADATGWELAWNPKYKGKISLWDGASTEPRGGRAQARLRQRWTT